MEYFKQSEVAQDLYTESQFSVVSMYQVFMMLVDQPSLVFLSLAVYL